MNATYDDALRRHPQLLRAAEQGTEALDWMVRRLKDPVDAEWALAEDKQSRPGAIVRLTDWSGSVSGTLTADELKDAVVTKLRLERLWGNLLDVRLDAQGKKVAQMVAALDGE